MDILYVLYIPPFPSVSSFALDSRPDPNRSEPPAKKIKLEPTELVTDADVSSLEKPILICINPNPASF